MTWGEFKQHVEENGVVDDTDVNFIDVVGGEKELVEVDVVVEEEGVQIY